MQERKGGHARARAASYTRNAWAAPAIDRKRAGTYAYTRGSLGAGDRGSLRRPTTRQARPSTSRRLERPRVIVRNAFAVIVPA